MQYPIKVLMLVPNLRIANGVASCVMNYYRKLDHNRVKMDFVSYKNIESPYISEIEANGDRVFYISSWKQLRKHIRDCESVVNGSDYHIIHNNSLLITLPMMILAKKKIPCRILHSHNTKVGETAFRDIRNKAFLPLLLETMNQYAACSSAAGKALFGNADFKVIPNVIDITKYKFSEEKRFEIRSKENCNNKIIIGTVARIAAAKNPFFAVDVIEKVLQNHKNVEYWWIGSGGLDSQMQEYICSKNLENKIRLFGSRTDVDDLYQALDIFFLPSVFEGLPVTGVEAQAMGLPCVISDNVTREMVYTDLVEYVPLDKPIEHWADIIERQILRIPERRPYSEELMQSEFSSDNAGENLENYYKDLLRNL